MAIIDYKDDIHKDTFVYPPNIYFGNGQGCGTLWFYTPKEAKDFITKHGRLSGRDSGLCKKCQNHYSFGTPEYKKYPPFACKQWKEKIAGIKQN